MVDELHGASRRIRNSSPTYEVYDAAVEEGKRLIDADVCEFLSPEGDQLSVLASTGVSGTDHSYSIWKSLPGQAFRTGIVCVIGDLHDTRSAQASKAAPSKIDATHRSLCMVPVGERGILLAKAFPPDAFTPDDAAQIQKIAAVVVNRLERASSAPCKHRSDGGKANDRDETEILDEVADILSHDLKNPLNVVQGTIELARESGDDEHFEQALSSLERIEQLIDETVFLARTGTMVEGMEVVDFGEAVQVAWANVETGDSTLTNEASGSIVASRRSLYHLLENLIENAVKYAGPGASVQVDFTDDGFSFEDDGPGVPQEHREHIFDRGFSLERGQSGLGLSIAKRIAEAHGWEIRVESASIGGARFEIHGIDITDD